VQPILPLPVHGPSPPPPPPRQDRDRFALETLKGHYTKPLPGPFIRPASQELRVLCFSISVTTDISQDPFNGSWQKPPQSKRLAFHVEHDDMITRVALHGLVLASAKKYLPDGFFFHSNACQSEECHRRSSKGHSPIDGPTIRCDKVTDAHRLIKSIPPYIPLEIRFVHAKVTAKFSVERGDECESSCWAKQWHHRLMASDRISYGLLDRLPVDVDR
jgi:hypothetical protein